MKRWQSLLLGIIVSVLLLAYALNGVDLNKLGGVLVSGNYLYLIPVLLITLASMLLRSLRWRTLLYDRITISHSFNILNASYLFNTFLPLRLGEVVRAYMVTRLEPPIPLFTALSSVVVERLMDLFAVVVLVLISVVIAPVDPRIQTAATVTAIFAVVGTVVLAVFAARPSLAHQLLNLVLRLVPVLERLHLRSMTDRLLEGIAPLASGRTMLITVGWSAVAWLASILAVVSMMFIFYEKPPIQGALLLTAVASLAIAIPAVPGNVGSFEAGVIFGMTAGGMVVAGNPALDQNRAFAFAVALHILNVAVYTVLGMLGLSQERISLGEVAQAARQMASGNRDKAVAEEDAKVGKEPA